MLNWSNLFSEKFIEEENGCYVAKERSNFSKNNYETAFEDDYLRLIRSASIRRLQDKTQVFPLDSTDYVRTRLTNSCEVEAISSFIIRQVHKLLKDQDLDINEEWMIKAGDILSCASFLHDLGNPPFGHYGEEVIGDWFKRNLEYLEVKQKNGTVEKVTSILSESQQRDLMNFEGNAQTLRIISKLHKQSSTQGMKLTVGVLDSIIKYPCSSIEVDKSKGLFYKKFNYFESESKVYEKIKETTKTKGCRNPLTYILEASDDIAYIFSDLEDGYKKGMFTLSDLQTLLKIVDDETKSKNLNQKPELEVLNDIITKSNNEREAVLKWISNKQLYSAGQIPQNFVDNYEMIMDGTFSQELKEIGNIQYLMKSLKSFSIDKIYNHPDILRQELLGKEIVEFLLERFVTAILNEDNIEKSKDRFIMLMSENYKENYKIECTEENDCYQRLLLVTDTISGMTDGYAKRFYQQLRGIE